ncbi:Protein fem-1 -like protein B [Halotydeus destructor]|nr:Protein fem-1 -like protein B [Halotydeus destructor]
MDGKQLIRKNLAILQRCVYEAARDGIAVTLNNLLFSVDEDDVTVVLNALISDCSMKCTPFIIAAKNGHENVVKLLLDNYTANLEIEGTVEYNGHRIEGTTALWCAAAFGHINVVKTLMLFGADVNHATKALSTPLRAACFEGRLDIVSCLLANGADLSIANKFNNTCLMIAAYRGHLQIVEYLLSQDCNSNSQAKCGGTALHFAAETGNLEIVKCLLENNAAISKNAMGMTPIISAAERTKANIVEYFVSTEYVSRKEKIEALELLGASYANDKENYSWERAYHYLAWALKERFVDPEHILAKNVLPPIEAYDNHVECQTPQELDNIRTSLCALHMEGLIVRERILGTYNSDIVHPITYRGALYADTGRFDRCVMLWMHALRIKVQARQVISKDITRFSLIFCRMMHVGISLPQNILNELIKITTSLLFEKKQQLLSETDEKEKTELCADLDVHMVKALCLIVMASKVRESILCKDDELPHLIYKINKLDLKTAKGETLLHLCVNVDTPLEDPRLAAVCRFPCAKAAKLLIQTGSDVNAMTVTGDTPLHVIVHYHKSVSDFLTLHAIITALVEANAHLDYVNNKGLTPLEGSMTGIAEIILRTTKESSLSLKCLAAQTVCRNNVSYETHVPVHLHEFVKLHGPRETIP